MIYISIADPRQVDRDPDPADICIKIRHPASGVLGESDKMHIYSLVNKRVLY